MQIKQKKLRTENLHNNITNLFIRSRFNPLYLSIYIVKRLEEKNFM